MKCKNCGREIGKKKFCGYCGNNNNGNRKRVLLCVLLGVLIVVAIGVGIFVFGGSSDKSSQQQASQDITTTLESLLDSNESGEVYMFGMVPNGKSNSIFSDNPISKSISNLVVYDVKSVNVQKDSGTFVISITSPDVYSILNEIVEMDTSINDTDDLLEAVSESLNSTYPTIEKNIECELKLSNDHWFIVPNEDLFNCLSGNLYSYYMNLGENVMNDILGGDSNE